MVPFDSAQGKNCEFLDYRERFTFLNYSFYFLLDMQDKNFAKLNRLYWHSRRSKLELDLLLMPFAKNRLGELNASLIEDFESLLGHEDRQLEAWLFLDQHPPEELAGIISEIIDYVAANRNHA